MRIAGSHLDATSAEAGSAANSVAETKTAKYAELTITHVFTPIAIKTVSSYNEKTIDVIK